jgi:hypothetical protein
MTQREGRRPRRAKARATAADRRVGPTATYRDLVIRGFASAEAANLTAYLHDLPIEEQPWTLRQVNTVVFLRKLRESGQFGSNDGGHSPFGPPNDAPQRDAA